jgi:hypothetical protein
MSHARSSKITVCVALAGLCFGVAGCGLGGSKITKANAEKVNTGMTEKEVSGLLGPPNESNEAVLPDIAGMLGGGGAPGTPEMTKKARESVWKEGDKIITVQFIDGKVIAKTASGL